MVKFTSGEQSEHIYVCTSTSMQEQRSNILWENPFLCLSN